MTVFVHYDPSPRGRRALVEAGTWARVHARPLHVVRLVTHESGGDSPVRARSDMRSSFEAESHLDHVRDELARDGIDTSVEVLHALQGSEARVLLDAAAAAGAELIVIGIRRRSRVGKLLMGSLSQDLLLEAPCPVLAVKGPPDEE